MTVCSSVLTVTRLLLLLPLLLQLLLPCFGLSPPPPHSCFIGLSRRYCEDIEEVTTRSCHHVDGLLPDVQGARAKPVGIGAREQRVVVLLHEDVLLEWRRTNALLGALAVRTAAAFWLTPKMPIRQYSTVQYSTPCLPRGWSVTRYAV